MVFAFNSHRTCQNSSARNIFEELLSAVVPSECYIIPFVNNSLGISSWARSIMVWIQNILGVVRIKSWIMDSGQWGRFLSAMSLEVMQMPNNSLCTVLFTFNEHNWIISLQEICGQWVLCQGVEMIFVEEYYIKGFLGKCLVRMKENASTFSFIAPLLRFRSTRCISCNSITVHFPHHTVSFM